LPVAVVVLEHLAPLGLHTLAALVVVAQEEAELAAAGRRWAVVEHLPQAVLLVMIVADVALVALLVP